MALSKKDVKHIAKLARLGLSGKEKKKYLKDLGGILDYMEMLNEVDTKNVEPLVLVTGLKNVLRKDENFHQLDIEKVKQIISQAAEREDNFIKTKPVLENK